MTLLATGATRLGIFAGVLCWVACALSAPTARPGLPNPGRYGADTEDPGFVQLSVENDGSVLFLHVVTLHLPPHELERHKGKLLKNAEGRVCITPEPRNVQPCLDKDEQGRWIVTLRDSSKRLTLTPEPAARKQ